MSRVLIIAVCAMLAVAASDLVAAEPAKAATTIDELFERGSRIVQDEGKRQRGEPTKLEGMLLLGMLGDERGAPLLINAFQKETEPKARAEALRALGWLRSPKAGPIFAAALKDEKDKKIRSQAAAGLGRLGEARYASDLEAHLADEEEDVRRGAVMALGVLRQQKSAAPLARRLGEEPSKYARFEIADALGLIGGETAVAALKVAAADDDDSTVRFVAGKALEGKPDTYGLLTPPPAREDVRGLTVKLLLERWSAVARKGTPSYSDPTSRDALIALALTGDNRAVPVLVASWQTTKSVELQHTAVRALGLLNSPKSVPWLERILRDKDKEAYLRIDAIGGLQAIGERKSAPALEKVLADEDEDEVVRTAAINALGDLGSESSVEPLFQRLALEKEPNDRFMIVAALGKIRSKTAIPRLEVLLKDDDPIVRASAAFAISQIQGTKLKLPPFPRE
jgi:HEAT repeat protein